MSCAISPWKKRSRRASIAALGILAAPLAALPPSTPDPTALVQTGHPVASIPTADSVRDFQPLDGEHVMLATDEHRYLLTLNRECVGLRWARHVGVTASDNTIWAGFDALTADGEACPIREIHRVTAADRDAL
jgi:hypothetical protein